MIKKGDTVVILSGKDRGKKGKVLEALPRDGKVIVERVGVVKKHQRPTREFQGGIIEKPMPLNVSKVMLVCSHCHLPSRIKKREVDGQMKRACLRCGEIMDKA